MNINRLMRFRPALNRSLVVVSLAMLQFACSADNDTPLIYDPQMDLNPLGPTTPNHRPPVTTDADNPDFWIINGGVEDGVAPWQSRGDGVSISQSSAMAYAGSNSLLVEGRSDDWHGAQMHLPLDLPDNTYRASVWVRLAEGESPTTVKLTMERKEFGQTVPDYPTVAQGNVTSDDWVQVTGTFSHQSPNALETLLFYIEAENPTASYYIDELSLVVADAGSAVDPADPSGWIINGDVESGVAPWRGNPENVVVTQQAEASNSGDYSLLVTGRADNWHGPVMDLPKTLPVERTYQASIWVLLAPGEEDSDVQLTLKRQLDGQPGDAEGIYISIASAESVNDEEWVQLLGTFEHPPFEGELADFYLYVEATSVVADFYVDDLELVNAGELVFNSDLEISMEGWAGFAGATVERTTAFDARSGDYSLLVSGRTQPFQGGSFSFAALSLGYSYNISCWVKMAPGLPETALALNLKIAQDDGTNDTDAYPEIAELENVTSDAWVQLSGTYVYQLNDPDIAVTEIVGYVQAPKNATAEYLIDDCSVTLQ